MKYSIMYGNDIIIPPRVLHVVLSRGTKNDSKRGDRIRPPAPVGLGST